MPSGFGFYRGRKPIGRELRVLTKLKAGKTPTALAESTTQAVRALAAEDGITLPTISSGSTAWRDRAIIAAVVLLALSVVFVPANRLRGRGDAR
jgi:hypothetical protein